MLNDPSAVSALPPGMISWLKLNSLLDADKQKIGKILDDTNRFKLLESMYAEHMKKKAELQKKMSEIVALLAKIIDSVKTENRNVKAAFEKASAATGPVTTEWASLKDALVKGNKTLNEAKDEYKKYLDTKKEFDDISAPDAAAAASSAGTDTGIGKSGGSNLYSKKNRKSHTASRPRSRRTRKHSSASSSHHKKMKFVHHS